MHDAGAASLVCRVGALLCALPLAHVGETMRALPAEPLAGVPSFVRGRAVVRGRPTPVIDAAVLLLDGAGEARRFVTVSPGHRPFMLAVDDVVGVTTLPPGVAATLPSLLQTPRLAAVAAAGTLDGDLMLFLQAALLVPDDVWAAIDRRGQPT
jgi:purine-binding chemotaxis protein CheW